MSLDLVETWSLLSIRDRQQLGRALSHLLAEGVVPQGSITERNPHFVLLRRFEAQARAYLQTVDLDFDLDVHRGVAWLVTHDSRFRVNLGKSDSIVLCLLRLIYHEQMGQAGTSRRIATTVADLQDKLLAHGGDEARPLTQKALVDALRGLRKLAIVELPGGRLEAQPDTVIEILPAIEIVLDDAALAQTPQRLPRYLGVEPDEDETTDESEP